MSLRLIRWFECHSDQVRSKRNTPWSTLRNTWIHQVARRLLRPCAPARQWWSPLCVWGFLMLEVLLEHLAVLCSEERTFPCFCKVTLWLKKMHPHSSAQSMQAWSVFADFYRSTAFEDVNLFFFWFYAWLYTLILRIQPGSEHKGGNTKTCSPFSQDHGHLLLCQRRLLIWQIPALPMGCRARMRWKW